MWCLSCGLLTQHCLHAWPVFQQAQAQNRVTPALKAQGYERARRLGGPAQPPQDSDLQGLYQGWEGLKTWLKAWLT